MLGLGRADDPRCSISIVWDQHQDLDARIDQLLRLLELNIVVAVRIFGNYLRTQLVRPLLEGIQVRLPTLHFQGVDGETDLQRSSVGLLRLRAGLHRHDRENNEGHHR